jgi:autotransporter-associated beta strand protein
MKRHSVSNPHPLFAAALCALFAAASVSYAGPKTNNGAWAAAGSWSPSGIPVSTDWVFRTTTGSASLNADHTVDSLTIRLNAGGTHELNSDASGPYSNFSVTLNQTGLGGITNAVTVIGTGAVFRVGDTAGSRGIAAIELGGTNTDFSFLVGTGNTLWLSDSAGSSEGRIEGAGKNLALNGTGTYTFDTANTFGGVGNTVTLNGGRLNINHASALGNANNRFIINGGTIDNNSTGAVTVAGNAQTWNNNFTFAGTRDLNMGSGAVTLGNHVTITAAQSNLLVGGVIRDNGNNYNLTKSGAGVMTVSGSISNSGQTVVQQGTLSLASGATIYSSAIGVSNGAVFNVSALAGGLTLRSGQTLYGNGTVRGAVTAGNGSTIAPGASIGQLSMTNLTLATGGKVTIEISGTTTPGVDYDRILGSNATLTHQSDWILELVFLNPVDAPISGTLKVLDFAGYSGANAPQLQVVGLSDSTSYDPTTGEVTFLNASVVPEPGTLALLALSGALLYLRRRTRTA